VAPTSKPAARWLRSTASEAGPAPSLRPLTCPGRQRGRRHSHTTNEHRMPTDEKPGGPASYFPSIEKKYGQPIEHWLELVRNQQGIKHMDMVKWLKAEHGLGHGHANAIVAFVLARPK
jgi:hypothetical protein